MAGYTQVEFGSSAKVALLGYDQLRCNDQKPNLVATGMRITAETYVDTLHLLCGPLPRAEKPVADGTGRPTPARYCSSYEQAMVALLSKAKANNCAFLREGGGWEEKRSGYWYAQCMKSQEFPKYNRPALERKVAACANETGGETPGGGDGGKSVTAINATNVYPKNDGESVEICAMNEGDTGLFLETKPDESNWVHVGRITGNCRGRSGWVWNGGDLKIE
jgi:hypothetical protein